jgi:hypothetical protein
MKPSKYINITLKLVETDIKNGACEGCFLAQDYGCGLHPKKETCVDPDHKEINYIYKRLKNARNGRNKNREGN